jgi:hypothetical protein
MPRRFSFQVLAFSAEFCTFQTTLPLYWLVPDRVSTWTCPTPLPLSASTGATTTRNSPTKSGLMLVEDCIPNWDRLS